MGRFCTIYITFILYVPVCRILAFCFTQISLGEKNLALAFSLKVLRNNACERGRTVLTDTFFFRSNLKTRLKHGLSNSEKLIVIQILTKDEAPSFY